MYKGDWDEDFDGMTRVIALEGEKVKISTAQFYIDGKKLDTFYGRAHDLGMDFKGFANVVEGEYKQDLADKNEDK
ncbi:hypothetical protein KHA97_12060 [Bacillus sp. FJAT-49870]|uniref:Uncharacterized protein n=2 Tax=Lederbergia citri TaxID=2833580 RepID=A0A942TFB1_9BACI|nr:hypothetical protein [Lederbergia citri]